MGPNSPSKDPRPAVFLTGEEGREEGREESGLAKRIRSLWSAIFWMSPRLEGIESVYYVYGCKRVCFEYQSKD